jgi:succinate-acetate transporter protein
MTRTLKQQLGMEPIDDAPEHVQVGGNRLTKIVTRGGHEIDSQQPGLPVYHRRIGNPYPLFAIAIGGTFIMLGALDLNLRGLQGNSIWLTVALPLSGIGGITSMMFAFAEGNTFLATAAGSLAGIIGGISLSFIPWTGIQGAYIIAAEGSIPLGTLALYKVSASILKR